MKSTGIIRSIDPLGRIVLPKELRRSYQLEEGTALEIFTDNDSIVLRKYRPAGSCDFCGEVTEDTVLFHGRYVCAACRNALAKL